MTKILTERKILRNFGGFNDVIITNQQYENSILFGWRCENDEEVHHNSGSSNNSIYPFSGNANDMTGNGHDGTVYGATLTTDRFVNPDSAYSRQPWLNIFRLATPQTQNAINWLLGLGLVIVRIRCYREK